MNSRNFYAVAAGAAAALALVTGVAAQTPPAPVRPAGPAIPPVAPPAVRHGPVLPGVCTYSSDKAMQASDLGKYVAGRLNQIATAANTELKTEDTAIQAEAKAIDAIRATLSPDALEKRMADLQVRANAYKRKQQLRQAEFQATERKAYLRVIQELDPIAVGVYQTRNCSILLGEGVLAGNPAMDITDQVILGLNAKIKSFTFERERLDTPPPVAGAPAPR
jgi:outer membrane protein